MWGIRSCCRVRAILVVAMIFGSSCNNQSANGSSPSASRRDSAGITIVESTAPQWGDSARWTVDPTPALDLTQTGSGPAHEFEDVTDAIRLKHGSIVLVDDRAAQVRFYSQEGQHFADVGRDGEGPGEFRRLTTIDRYHADSLIVFDRRLRRMTVVTPNREVARVITPARFDDYYTREFHVLGDGSFVTMPFPSPPPDDFTQPGSYRLQQPVLRMSGASGAVDTVVSALPAFQGHNGESGDFPPLFAANGHVAVSETRVYVGSADSMRYDVYEPDSRHTIVRVPGYDLRLTADQNSAERAARVAGLPDAPQFMIDRFADAMNELPDAKTRPAYQDLLIDAQDHVWAVEYRGVSEEALPVTAQVFDPDGAWLGAVELPPRFTAFEIGVDYVLGNWTDELDVEHPQLLRLKAPIP